MYYLECELYPSKLITWQSIPAITLPVENIPILPLIGNTVPRVTLFANIILGVANLPTVFLTLPYVLGIPPVLPLLSSVFPILPYLRIKYPFNCFRNQQYPLLLSYIITILRYYPTPILPPPLRISLVLPPIVISIPYINLTHEENISSISQPTDPLNYHILPLDYDITLPL